MKRWLPFPRFSLTLLVTWLLASQSVSPGNLALGTIVDRGIVATGTGVYAMLAVAEILSIYKAAFDARYERGQ